MKIDIDFFVQDRFKILAHMYDKRNVDNEVNITQAELGKVLFICRASANKVVGELCKEGYLIHSQDHVSRYTLTKKAIKVVEAFRQAAK